MKGDYREAFSWLAIGVLIEIGDCIYRKLENRQDNRRNSDELYWGIRGDHIDRGIERSEGVYDQEGLEHMSEQEGRELADEFDVPFDIDDIPLIGVYEITDDPVTGRIVDDIFKESRLN